MAHHLPGGHAAVAAPDIEIIRILFARQLFEKPGIRGFLLRDPLFIVAKDPGVVSLVG